MPNATTDGPSSFDPTPAPSEFETHLEKWLPPLLTLLGSYSTGVIYLRFKMNMGGPRHLFSLSVGILSPIHRPSRYALSECPWLNLVIKPLLDFLDIFPRHLIFPFPPSIYRSHLIALSIQALPPIITLHQLGIYLKGHSLTFKTIQMYVRLTIKI